MSYTLKQPIVFLGLTFHSVIPILNLIQMIEYSLSEQNKDNHLSMMLLSCNDTELEIITAYLKADAKVLVNDAEKLNGLRDLLKRRINCEIHDRIINAHDDDFDFISAKSINSISIFEDLEN